MKDFFVVCVTVVLLYLGYNAMQPVPPPPKTPVMMVAATPAPTAVPKVYFHSALDASAMAPGMSTGTSYFSTDPNSRFVASYGSGTAGSYVATSSTYVVVPGGSSTAAASTSRLTANGQTLQAPEISYVQRKSPRPTPNPNGSAR